MDNKPKVRRRWYRWRWLPLLVASLCVGTEWIGFRWKKEDKKRAYVLGSTSIGNESHYLSGATTLESPDVLGIEPDRMQAVIETLPTYEEQEARKKIRPIWPFVRCN